MHLAKSNQAALIEVRVRLEEPSTAAEKKTREKTA